MTKGLILIYTVITVIFISCKPSAPTIITVGDESITTDEFKYIYAKNHSKDDDNYTQASLDKYLQLFINYRLKVLEAENEKMDSTTAFQTELDGYKKQLAKPYFADDLLTEQLAKEAYTRSKTAIKARHILIKTKETASPQDTLFSYNRIKNIKDSIENGADFGDMAFTFSEDPSAQRSKGKPGHRGNLGYFSSLRMVYAFENAAFNTQKSETSNIIRTQFGYHILQVQDIVKMDYKVRVAHIMINAANGLSSEDSIAKYKTINLIYTELQNGGNWDTLCLKYSNHSKTREQGGNLPEFTLGGSLGLPNFELGSYKLTTIGEISKPIKTPYGWHIIKLQEKVPFKSYDSVKLEYIEKVKKDARSQQNKSALVNKLKQENKFKETKSTALTLESLTDKSIVTKQWKIEDHSEQLQKNLFSIGKQAYTVYDFGQYIEQNQTKLPKGAKEYLIQSLYNDFVSTSLISYEEGQLSTKHFEYKMLIQEFHDGILIYDLMKKQIWDKANDDTIGLRTFFNENISNYNAPDNITGSLYLITNNSYTASIRKDIEDGLSPNTILLKHNTDSLTNVTVESRKFTKDEDAVLKQIQWNLQNSIELVKFEGNQYIIKKDKVDLNRSYRLTEIRGRVVADYQKQLEATFIQELKTKYPVKVIEKEYNTLIKL